MIHDYIMTISWLCHDSPIASLGPCCVPVHLEPLITERWSAPCDEGTRASELRRDVDAPPGLEQKSSWEGPGCLEPSGWRFYMILQSKCGFFNQGFKSRKMMVGWCYINCYSLMSPKLKYVGIWWGYPLLFCEIRTGAPPILYGMCS